MGIAIIIATYIRCHVPETYCILCSSSCWFLAALVVMPLRIDSDWYWKTWSKKNHFSQNYQLFSEYLYEWLVPSFFFLERTKRRGKKECTPIPTTHPSNSYLLLHIQPPPLHYSCLISSITHSADYYAITTMTVRVKTFLSCKFVTVFDRPMLSDIC